MTGFSAPWFYGMMVAEISPRKGGAHHIRQARRPSHDEGGSAALGGHRLPDTGQAEKLPPYLVFGDKTLVDMCAKAPRQLEDMKEIYGMGERKFAKYGKQFFAAIEDYRREHPEAEFTGA